MASSPKARILLQQCLSARLQVEPPSDEKDGVFVEVSSYISLFSMFGKLMYRNQRDTDIETV